MVRYKIGIAVSLAVLLAGCFFAPDFNCDPVVSYHGFSVSPDSKYVVSREPGVGDSVFISARGVADSTKMLFNLYVGNRFIIEALWLDERRMILETEQHDLILLDTRSGSFQSIEILHDLEKDIVCVDSQSHRVFVLDIDEFGENDAWSELWTYEVDSDFLFRHRFQGPRGQGMHMSALGPDSLLAGIGGGMYIISLVEGSIDEVVDSQGNLVPVGESPINVLSDSRHLLISIYDDSLALFDMYSRVLTPLPEYGRYAFPLLSPNEEFMFVTGPTEPYRRYLITNPEPLRNALERTR